MISISIILVPASRTLIPNTQLHCHFLISLHISSQCSLINRITNSPEQAFISQSICSCIPNAPLNPSDIIISRDLCLV